MARIISLSDQDLTFQNAARDGQMGVLKEMIQEVDINSIGNEGLTALHYSAINNHVEVVKYLIENGADINVKDNNGQTPFYIAAREGKLEIVKLFLDFYADFFPNDLGKYCKVANFFLENNENINEKKGIPFTPLYIAALKDQQEVVKFLLVNFDQKRTATEGNTHLLIATHKGHLNVVKCLLENGDTNVDTKNKNGWTPLHVACQTGQLEVVKCLIGHGGAHLVDIKTEIGSTPLHIACKSGKNLEMVKYLLNNAGAKIDIKDKQGWTPLHLATKNINAKEIAKCLLRNGAAIDAKNEHGSTPLHIAVLEGKLDLVKFLLKNGANIDSKSKFGSSPLHLVIRDDKKMDILKCLLKNGADTNFMDNDWAPLHTAAYLGLLDIVKCLVENGADIKIKHGGDGETPLQKAAKKGHFEIVEFLSQLKNCKKRKKKVENENSEEDDDDDDKWKNLDCIICENPRNGVYALIPCGDASLCESCCAKMIYQNPHPKCPTCRKRVHSYQEIFLQVP